MQLARCESRGIDELVLSLREITEVAAETLDVARVSVWLFDQNFTTLSCIDRFDSRRGEHSGGLELEVTESPLYFEALRQEGPVIVSWTRTDARTKDTPLGHPDAEGVTSFMHFPMHSMGSQIGAVCHEHIGMPRVWTREEQEFARSLTELATFALESYVQSVERSELEQSLELAQRIQDDLMPRKVANLPWVEVSGWCRPAKHASGDLYDFIPTPGGDLAVVLGDVSGHGIGPALITAAAQASLRAYTSILDDPAVIVTRLNTDLTEHLDDGMFLTLFLGLLSADGELRYVNAGHPTPLVWRREAGAIEPLVDSGPAVGILDAYEYTTSANVALDVGDAIVAYSDGLLEARHHAEHERHFGEAGVRDVLDETASANSSADDIAEALLLRVLDFSGKHEGAARKVAHWVASKNRFLVPPEDDMTAISVRRIE